MPDYRNSPGFLYLEATKHDRDTILGKAREKISSPEPFKIYPDAEKIKLPEPSTQAADIWSCLIERRSVRRYSSRPIPAEFLSSLLWASQGVTATAGRYLLRTAPSAGALYPIETYVCINRSDSIKAGLYHYELSSGLLELLKAGSFGEALSASAFGQTMCQKAPVVFIWSAIPRRTMAKYGSRGNKCSSTVGVTWRA